MARYQGFVDHRHASTPGWASASAAVTTPALAKAYTHHHFEWLRLHEAAKHRWPYPTRTLRAVIIAVGDDDSLDGHAWLTVEDMAKRTIIETIVREVIPWSPG